MSDVNEHLERLMVRSLDGALSEDDELALNRELIRNPEARRLMAAFRTVDELSVAALDEVTAGETPVFDARTWARAGSSRRLVRQGRTWFWLVSGAIAAALLAMVVPRPVPTSVQRPPLVQSTSSADFCRSGGIALCRRATRLDALSALNARHPPQHRPGNHRRGRRRRKPVLDRSRTHADGNATGRLELAGGGVE
jgi:hypothetical protein